MLISIIVPVYNSSDSLKILYDRITNVFSNLDYDFELIMVDDKSPNSEVWATMMELAEQNMNVKILQFTRNFGQQAATLCGIAHSKGDYIITMDDDLQHRPEDIPNLLLEKGHDIVIGEFTKKKHSLFKVMTSRLKGYFDYLIIGKPKHIQLSPFRLMNRIVADGIQEIRTAYPFIPALLFYVSKDVVSVRVTHDKRFEGKSNYSYWKMIKLFSNLIINNSHLMLKVIGHIGLLVSSLSFIFAIIVIIRKLLYDINIVGWASNIVILLFLGGLILFTLGIIGEYLSRIIVGMERKPTYLIRHKKNL